jgi:hypothetical protein
MKKRSLGLIILVLSIMLFSNNAYALDDVYYTTPNGIELTRDEYVFLTTFFWDGYPDVMTEKQYSEIKELDLVHRDIKIKKIGQDSKFIGPENGGTRGTYNYENSRSLQIGAACDTTTCYNSLLAIWDGNPNVRSWDVIGAYLTNASVIAHQDTFVYSTSGLNDFYNIVSTTHGLGNSVLLPSTGDDLLINMTFTSTKNGRIYGSYQHAMSYTNLATSQNYTFSLGGYGNVFLFSGNAASIYDETAGVDIDI